MAIAKNVATGEKVVRIILGLILIVGAFSLAGFWKPLLIILGVIIILTALVAY